MIYIITFSITIFFMYFAQKRFEKHTWWIGTLYSLFVILVPSIIAGCRDENVGTDLQVYVNKTFNYALSSPSLSSFFYSYHDEFLYGILNYVVSRFTNDVHWLYFCSELIIMFLIFWGIFYYRKIIPMWMSMLVYLFLFYNMSLNLMRQSIALAIIFFATRYIFEKKAIKYLIFTVIAAQFHTSAYIAVSLYIIYLLVVGKRRKFIKICIIVGILLGMIYLNEIAILLNHIGILPLKYLFYANGSFAQLYGQGKNSLLSIDFILRMGILLVYSIFYKYLKANKEQARYTQFLYIILIGDTILSQSSAFSFAYASRVGLYFSYLLLVSFPQIIAVFNKRSRLLLCMCIITYCLVYWYFRTDILGYEETWPYTSQILGIYK